MAKHKPKLTEAEALITFICIFVYLMCYVVAINPLLTILVAIITKSSLNITGQIYYLVCLAIIGGISYITFNRLAKKLFM